MNFFFHYSESAHRIFTYFITVSVVPCTAVWVFVRLFVRRLYGVIYYVSRMLRVVSLC